MRTFTFGLHEDTASQEIVTHLQRLMKKNTTSKVATDLIAKPGNHILPFLHGDDPALKVVRARYRTLLGQAIPTTTLKNRLQAELTELAKGSEEMASEHGGTISGDSFDECPWWIPDVVCDWLDIPTGDGDGDENEDEDEDWPDDDDWPDEDDLDDDSPDDCPQCYQLPPCTLYLDTGEMWCEEGEIIEIPCEDAPYHCQNIS